MEDNYSIVMVFAIRQYELTVVKHVSPSILKTPTPSLPTPSLPSFHRGLALGALRHTSNSTLVICFTRGNAYVSMLFSQLIPASLSPTSLFNVAKFSTFWGILYFIPSLLHQLFLYMLAEAIKWFGFWNSMKTILSWFIFLHQSSDDPVQKGWGWRGRCWAGWWRGLPWGLLATLHIMKWGFEEESI